MFSWSNPSIFSSLTSLLINQSNQPTSSANSYIMSSTYIPPFRRHFAPNEERSPLTLQDFYARFHSKPPQKPRVQRPLSADELHSRFKQSKQNVYPTPSDSASDPPSASPRSFRSLSPRPFLSKKLSLQLPDI